MAAARLSKSSHMANITIESTFFINGGNPHIHLQRLRFLVEQATLALPQAEIYYFDGAETSILEVRAALEGDLFTPFSLVVIEHIEEVSSEILEILLEFTKEHKDKKDKVRDHILILSRSAGVKGSRLQAQFSQAGASVIDIPDLKKDKDRLNYASTWFQEKDSKIDPSALQLLVEGYGTKVGDLIGACIRLSEETANGEVITIEQVRMMPGLSIQTTGFDIIEDALNGQMLRALELLRQVLAQGEEPVVLLAAFSYKMRQLALFAAHPDGEMLSANIKKYPSVFQKVCAQMRRTISGFTSEGFARCLDALASVDDSIKGGSGNTAYELERVVKIIGKKGALL